MNSLRAVAAEIQRHRGDLGPGIVHRIALATGDASTVARVVCDELILAGALAPDDEAEFWASLYNSLLRHGFDDAVVLPAVEADSIVPRSRFH